MIAALRPCSFVDWPGRLAAVAFTQGCNLACRYCHNPALVPRGAAGAAGAVPEGEVLRLLAARRGRLDGLVVTGGEPTLHAGLAPLLRRVKALGLGVKLDTNGTRPAAVAALLAEGLVDYLAIDLKATPARAGWLTGAARQAAGARRCLALALRAGVDHEVRTTLAAPVHDERQVEALARWAAGARRWALQRFRPGGHLDPASGLAPPAPALLDAARAAAGAAGLAVVVR
ncbi:anaerobic ribonucleoside-triphosphate reductase activating protein [Anaeromyxobacter diazotrophicus]|uniref:Anaerobic ribonucleoside-triphosphate reductase activating protein n=1 Tax=Anaeromyxobacter diazotrophicus TaxID=2590199 RepID=A0A7I9VR01_9BACT|nr:anaerobic ribonucleoside-triphosphate reductase activating protein [Anaeromyxobacter diazotrophicus]GEJ58688.1 anaerobic ribonucleoside-triphosphate reductase activating protein [Anaeromyxobacter diazotrophicus]